MNAQQLPRRPSTYDRCLAILRKVLTTPKPGKRAAKGTRRAKPG